MAIKEGERLDWYEEDGEWALVGSEAGVGFVPRNYVGEEGEEEEEVEEPQPMLALAPVVVKASTPPAASGGGAGAVMTWPVTVCLVSLSPPSFPSSHLFSLPSSRPPN